MSKKLTLIIKDETEKVKNIEIPKENSFQKFFDLCRNQLENPDFYDIRIYAISPAEEEKGINEDNYSEIIKNNFKIKMVCQKYKGINQNILDILNELEDEYYISAFLDIQDVINKIIELNGDKMKIKNWIEEKM